MAKRRLTEDTPFLRTPDMYQIETDAPIPEDSERALSPPPPPTVLIAIPVGRRRRARRSAAA